MLSSEILKLQNKKTKIYTYSITDSQSWLHTLNKKYKYQRVNAKHKWYSNPFPSSHLFSLNKLSHFNSKFSWHISDKTQWRLLHCSKNEFYAKFGDENNIFAIVLKQYFFFFFKSSYIYRKLYVINFIKQRIFREKIIKQRVRTTTTSLQLLQFISAMCQYLLLFHFFPYSSSSNLICLWNLLR